MITLSNGLRVANFSSPHPFTFTDGSVLSAVGNSEAERLKVTFCETLVQRNGYNDVELSFSLSEELVNEIDKGIEYHSLGEVDIILCPLPMLTAMKEAGYNLKTLPFRAIRMEDRIKKLVAIDKFCL